MDYWILFASVDNSKLLIPLSSEQDLQRIQEYSRSGQNIWIPAPSQRLRKLVMRQISLPGFSVKEIKKKMLVRKDGLFQLVLMTEIHKTIYKYRESMARFQKFTRIIIHFLSQKTGRKFVYLLLASSLFPAMPTTD